VYKYGNCRHHTRRKCALFVSAFHRRVSLCWFCNFFSLAASTSFRSLEGRIEIKGIVGPVRVLLLAFNVDYPGYCTSFFVAYLCVASGKLMEMRYAGSFVADATCLQSKKRVGKLSYVSGSQAITHVCF